MFSPSNQKNTTLQSNKGREHRPVCGHRNVVIQQNRRWYMGKMLCAQQW